MCLNQSRMSSTPGMAALCLLTALALCWPGCANLRAATDIFPLPGTSGWEVWQAEDAQRAGRWEVDGGSEIYLTPAAGEADGTLVFPFEADESMVLRVRPVWWRTGEQKLAHRFPYPFVREPGPDVVDAVGREVFCTAPAAGRVVIVDAVKESVVGFVEVGGYLSDLVADRAMGRLYVADALGDRVVAIDAGTRAVVGAVAVPTTPWALALDKGALYVACREAKRVVALDPSILRVMAEADIAAAPVGLQLSGASPGHLVVRLQEQAFNVLTLEAVEPDAERLPGAPDESWWKPEDEGEHCPNPDCACTWLERPGPHQLAVCTVEERKVFDVGEVTRLPEGEEPRAGFPDTPGPGAAGLHRMAEEEPLFAYFTAPSRGLVGVLNVDTGVLEEPIDVGGYLTRLIDDDGGKLYALDAAGHRLVIIDAATRTIEKEVALPGQPWWMARVGEVSWQREYIVPPTEVNRLFVLCTDVDTLAVVSVDDGSLIAELPLAADARNLKFVPMPNTGWWPTMPDDRIGFALSPRVAVELEPVTLDPATLESIESPDDVPTDAPRRTKVEVALPGADGGSTTFSADNKLVLGINAGAKEERWVDLTEVADPQRVPQTPIAAKEEPGSISLSLDGGPEFDWARGIWTGPDSEMFLINDSEEFWRHNAPALDIQPGRHLLRVRAHSEYARLNAIAVRRAVGREITLNVVPEPRSVHGQVASPGYEGVFYDEEPVRFTLEVSNVGVSARELDLSCSLRNYLGEVVFEGDLDRVEIDPGETRSFPLLFAPAAMGRHTLAIRCESLWAPRGALTHEAHFLRLPKLEHPRLFWRAADEEAIQARIARYPNLFRRYADWVERMAPQKGRFPERFLPPGLTADDCAGCAPEDIDDPRVARGRYGWRNYELGWRILAVQFANRFLKPRSRSLGRRVDALRAAKAADDYIMYHHHGPFFPGAAASIVDLAPDGRRDSLKLHELLSARYGDMDVMPWTVAVLEEPLTPQKRGLIYEMMVWENNAEHYFERHRGIRGGTWWLDPYTWCHCPMHGYTLSFLLLRNFFGEPRLFEKPIFSGYLTFQHYADPIKDNRELQPNLGGPGGEPWRWIFASLARHPLEKAFYDWEGWIENMDGPLAGDERQAVDALMALEGRPLTGPMDGHTYHFVSAVSVPIALALGWYEPEAPEVEMDELPPTAVFDVEGWVPMRSGWGKEATEVTFISGVREHTTRHKPNHLTIVKGGEYLLGTPALFSDDGNNSGAWANTVVVGDEWPERWSLNLQHPRDGEHLVINRFSPANFIYLDRDERLAGYRPAEDRWGGGLNLHGHTETLFMQEGRLLAYQTWPELDYAAGDAANAWPCDQVERAIRQVVFAKPDIVVVYDRVDLGPDATTTRWIAATGPELDVEGSSFRIASNSECLRGWVLLPENTVLANSEPMEPGWDWKDQKLLEVRPAAEGGTVEYLVVMEIGAGNEPAATPELVRSDDGVGVTLTLGGRSLEVLFESSSPAGGKVGICEAGKETCYLLREGIVDSYEGWRHDTRYQRWMNEARFDFVVRGEGASE